MFAPPSSHETPLSEDENVASTHIGAQTTDPLHNMRLESAATVQRVYNDESLDTAITADALQGRLVQPSVSPVMGLYI